jgi:sugar lactone lactonase YvrE
LAALSSGLEFIGKHQEAEMMRRLSTWAGVAVLLAAAVANGPALFAQSKAKAENVPEIQYDSAIFTKLPAGLYLGESIGVATNSKGHVFVYTRSGETRLFEFDAQGNFVKEIGAGSYGMSFAHSVRVDAQDNIWAVDEGSNTIVKYSPDGNKVLMILGRRPDPEDQISAMPGSGSATFANKPYSFSRQTDVAFDPQGNIFVSDGYGDARVVKYDKNGRFVKSVAGRGNGPLQFSTPHSIAVDAKGMVYVGDRGNARVQVLDNDLNFVRQYDTVGNPWAVCVSGGPHQYLFVSNSWPDSADAANREYTGEVYKMELDGTIVGKFGKGGKGPKEFSTIHQMDCRDPNTIFTAEINNWRTQKVTLRATASSTGGGK